MDLGNEQAIVAAYKEGRKISAIVAEHEVSESMVYYVLDKHGVSPSRIHRKARFTKDGAIATLYEALAATSQMIETKDARIAELEAENERLQALVDTDEVAAKRRASRRKAVN